MTPPGNHRWIKSSYSNQEGGNCLEWSPASAAAHGTVPVRDSKTPHGPVLHFPATAFADFLAEIKKGSLSA